MAIKKFRPTTPGQRNKSTLVNEEITKSTPEKSLVVTLNKKAGRNNQGKITVRHQGGGSANIALINYLDGEKRYIIAPKGLKVGDKIVAGSNADIKTGNALPIMNIPVGTVIHNIELRPGKGGSLARSAGSSAQILGREGNYVMIRLSSGEQRRVLGTCMATIGVVGNEDSNLVKLGKAGRKRHMGIRPTVRGSVMNPNDHPHGGGEGRAPIGRKGPVTPWGKPALGYKTRNNKRTDKFIVRRRGSK